MHVLRDAESINAFLTKHLNAELNRLIERRIEDLADFDDIDLGDLVSFIVMEPADQACQLDDHLGFSVLANRFDGCRYGDSGFSPSWDELTQHSEWFELLYVLRDDGFGVVIFIPKNIPGSPELLAMCAAYASPTEVFE